MKRWQIHLLLAGSTLLLTAVSCLVVLQNAWDEPYVVFRQSDALIQVGVAMLLMLLWFQLALGMVYGVMRNRISAWCLPLLLWFCICEGYLSTCPRGYIQDIAEHAVRPQ